MTIPAIYNLYSKIILEALSVSQIKLNKCRRDFMIEVFILYLSILSITGYVVADAYFSKKKFVEKMRECSLHLVSKLRDDADLLYLSKQLNQKSSACQRSFVFRHYGRINIAIF